jgi:hypothetical protein
MSSLLFFSRSSAYRHAARTEMHKARLLLPGSERNQMRKRARALRDLARNEAWLEGQTLRRRRSLLRLATTADNSEPIDSARGLALERALLSWQQQPQASRRRINQDGPDCSRAASVPDPQSGD